MFEDSGDISNGAIQGNSTVPLIAEKTIKRSDGTTVVMSTVIPVDCGAQKTIDLNELMDSTQNKTAWIKVNATLNGTCLQNGTPVDELRVLFYENRNKRIVQQYQTDAQGKFQASIAPGNYRVVLMKDGYEPFVKNGVLLKEGQTHNITFDFTSRAIGPENGNVVKPILAPKRFTLPIFAVKVNGTSITQGQTVSLLEGATMTLDINVFDGDSGLGDLEGMIGQSKLFNPISVKEKVHLTKRIESPLKINGIYNVKLTAKDYDKISLIKPAQAGYYRIEVPKRGSAWFRNSIGVKIIGSNGAEKFNDIVIEDANQKVGKFVDLKVEAGDKVIPFIRVNTRTHRTKGIPQEYNRYIDDIDPFDDVPVCKAEIKNGKLHASFEDCQGEDGWCDWDYDDIHFVAWFTKEPIAGSAEILVETDPAHTVNFSFSVKVAPIIVEQSKIAGKVIDDTTNQPIQGAVVGIAGSEMSTFTDENGYFEILNVKPGTYDIVAFKDGYEKKTFAGIVVPE
jgi:uncharacterized GH25 family protein